MSESIEILEQRMEELRAAVRHATTSGDRVRAQTLRAELRQAEQAWDRAVAELERRAQGTEPPASEEPLQRLPGPLLPARDQVHQALTLVGAPTANRMIIAVHDAFFGSTLAAARLTSLRRDEERSFRSAPHSRPYYLCAALTYDLLSPARGLLAVSTWPMERRVIGPLSLRVNYLEAAIRVAEGILRIPDPGPTAQRLLRRFAVNIPGATEGTRPMTPDLVAQAARAELEVHQDEDHVHRREAAARATTQLDEASQLFGTRFQQMLRTGTASLPQGSAA
jgi:hypothetical protein